MAAESAAAIGIDGVWKTFGAGDKAVHALKGVGVDIRDNEFFTLLGPSGCGKTTLLRLIAGFELPTDGIITLFGAEIEHLPPDKRPVNTVFQHYALFPHMTVAQNVGFGLRMLKWARADIDKAVKNALALVKMADYGDRRPSQLSGGQQQRVAFARAMAPRPKVLLLDEPLSALDLKLRQAMRIELKNLQRETGITFVFVTHDQEEALTMSDRIAVMSAGEIRQIGTALDVYERPVDRFVADFIGDTNFLKGRIARIAKGEALVDCEGIPITAELGGERAVGNTVTLALRPEKIGLAPAGKSKGAGGTVAQAIYTGTDTTFLVDLPNGFRLSVRDANALSGAARFVAGDSVKLVIAPGAARMLAD